MERNTGIFLLSAKLKQEFAKCKLAESFLHTFSPMQPENWSNEPNSWLSNIDLHKAMKQYENAYFDFLFIGPSPINYDTIDYGNVFGKIS